MAQKKPAAPFTPTGPKRLTSIDEMQNVFTKPFLIRVTFETKEYEFEARRLTPCESAKLEEIVSRVIPPIIKGKTMEDDRPDYTNSEYQKTKTAAMIEARSLAIVWCVPAFKAGLEKKHAGPVNGPAVIIDYVQGLLNEQLLEAIYQAVRSSGVEMASIVNFS